MKNLPKEFILTNFERQEGTEVLKYHGNNDWLMNEWEYLVIRENDFDMIDNIYIIDIYHPHLPKISYKKWKEIVSPNVQEPFPEKWYIVVTSENRDVLNKWRHDNHSVSSDQFFKTGNGARLYSHDVSGDMTYFDISPLREYSQYVEITFDQFKKFVLKEDELTPMKIELPIVTHFVKINGNDLREIYENSNREGKLFLETRFANYNVFNKEFELSNVDIDFLRGTCNKEVVNKIFGEVIDFDKLQVGSKVELKDGKVCQILIFDSKWRYDKGGAMWWKDDMLGNPVSYTTTARHDIREVYQHENFLKSIVKVLSY